jgi:signal transduction histidine kinase
MRPFASSNAATLLPHHPMVASTLTSEVDHYKSLLEQSEDVILRLQKTEALGSLAVEIAHDFKNLVFGIMGYCDELRDSFDAGDARIQRVNEMKSAGKRAQTLAETLLQFSRGRTQPEKTFEINAYVQEMEGLLKQLLGPLTSLRWAPGRDADHVRMDPSQLGQIIINLVVNARSSMPAGGTVKIRMMHYTFSSEFRGSLPPLPPGKYACVQIRDTGNGMEAATLEKIFTPFFTTKERTGGTGLGLATVLRILERNKGGISVRSMVGDGSCFSFFLPIAGTFQAAAVLH